MPLGGSLALAKKRAAIQRKEAEQQRLRQKGQEVLREKRGFGVPMGNKMLETRERIIQRQADERFRQARRAGSEIGISEMWNREASQRLQTNGLRTPETAAKRNVSKIASSWMNNMNILRSERERTNGMTNAFNVEIEVIRRKIPKTPDRFAREEMIKTMQGLTAEKLKLRETGFDKYAAEKMPNFQNIYLRRKGRE